MANWEKLNIEFDAALKQFDEWAIKKNNKMKNEELNKEAERLFRTPEEQIAYIAGVQSDYVRKLELEIEIKQSEINSLDSELYHERANAEDMKGFVTWIIKNKDAAEVTDAYMDQLYLSYKESEEHTTIEVCDCIESSQFEGECTKCGKTILPF